MEVNPAGDAQLSRMPRLRLYEELVRRLHGYIDAAGLEVGSRLPPERELAKRLGVSRASVSRALVALEVQGIVDVRHGEGTYLRRKEAYEEPLERLLDRRRRLPEILEAREALECKLAELAAVRRTEADLEAIDAALDEMEADINRGGIGANADEKFHQAVRDAAKSAVLANLIKGLAEPIRETRMESLSQPGRPPDSLSGHRKIAGAIHDGNAGDAAAAMREHLRVVADVRLLRWQPDITESDAS